MDKFFSMTVSLNAPGAGAFEITPNNETTFEQPTRFLWVGTGGTLRAEMLGGDTATITGILSGSTLPLRVKRVYSTGTTATNLVGLY
jgi:hypothetical protein